MKSVSDLSLSAGTCVGSSHPSEYQLQHPVLHCHLIHITHVIHIKRMIHTTIHILMCLTLLRFTQYITYHTFHIYKTRYEKAKRSEQC